MMNDLPKDKFLPAFVNFSAQTSANQTQVWYDISDMFSYSEGKVPRHDIGYK